MEENKELKSSIQQFYNLLESYPDDAGTVNAYVEYLRSLLRMQSRDPLPKIEIMTLIKYNKPVVFEGLRKMARESMMLDILTNLSMDFQAAKQRLENILR